MMTSPSRSGSSNPVSGETYVPPGRRPARRWSKVVLPAPEGPMRMVIEPPSKVSVTSLMASFSGRAACRYDTSRTSISMVRVTPASSASGSATAPYDRPAPASPCGGCRSVSRSGFVGSVWCLPPFPLRCVLPSGAPAPPSDAPSALCVASPSLGLGGAARAPAERSPLFNVNVVAAWPATKMTPKQMARATKHELALPTWKPRLSVSVS
mmetsp:Transcript_15262/g.61374  ORF Transcript_15262/g.61374 Transcript_15262/m.61374 type:complete len:210 (-) Transcript_15262:829-1458(-)